MKPGKIACFNTFVISPFYLWGNPKRLKKVSCRFQFQDITLGNSFKSNLPGTPYQIKMAPRDGDENGPGRRPRVNQPAVADGQGPADWSDGEDDVDDDIVNDDDAEEGRVHHMFSRILNLRFFFTKFGKSFSIKIQT